MIGLAKTRIWAGTLFVGAVLSPAFGQNDRLPAKTALPDFSGVWNRDRGEGRLGAVKNLATHPDVVIGDYKDPILTPKAAAQVKRHADMERNGEAAPEPKQTCWPSTTPNILGLIGGVQILQTANVVTFLFGNDHQWRYVYLNEKHSAHPKPSWYGEAIGYYEGDTLVVDTIGVAVRPMSFIDVFGTPHTEAMHVVERYRVDGNVMKVGITVEDPGTYTRPWVTETKFMRSNNSVNESVCAFNNRLDVYGPSIGKMPEAKYIPPF